MNIDEIRRIAEIMQKHDLTEFSLESEDCRMKVRRGPKEGKVPMSAAPPSMYAPGYGVPQTEAAAANNSSSNGSVTESGPETNLQTDHETAKTIDSPIVGTFYSAPTPDAEPFVKPGDKITPETVICIVEAMKVMNEIKAETSGVIKRILVENTQPVEFGQPLFELE